MMGGRSSEPLAPGTFERCLRGVLSGGSETAWPNVVAYLAAIDNEMPLPAAGSTVAAAAVRGARADRVGYAFAAGYFAATAALTGRRDDAHACLAATEAGGNHPRAIAARLTDAGSHLVLDADKAFVTLCPTASTVLVLAERVAASEGVGVGAGAVPQAEGQRKDLVLVRVPRSRAGIVVEPHPAMAFCPEVPHARVRFEGVAIATDEVLPGEGFADWVKPFRTVEDTHVAAAVTGYALSLAKRGDCLADVGCALASTLSALFVVEAAGPGSAAAHLALAGALTGLRAALALLATALPESHTDARRGLERDLPLLAVAEKARAQRTKLALERLAAHAAAAGT